MFRSILLLLGLFLITNCAATDKKPEGQQTADAGYIQFESPIQKETKDSAALEKAKIESIDRDRLRSEIFSLDSEIANKQSQITHFKMLGDNIWNNQVHVLQAEIANLMARKASIESQLY